MENVLAGPDTQIRLFGKRRMGVALARDTAVEKAREKAREASAEIRMTL